jgi:hypothetical protein
MYCWKCGAQAPDAAKFCTTCGAALTPEPRAPLAARGMGGTEPTSVSIAPSIAVGGERWEPLYAGFWRRFAAYIVDSLVLLVPQIIIFAALDKREGWALLLQAMVWWLYKALMESSNWQATLGKKALGIKVSDEYGQRISFGRASARFWGVSFRPACSGSGC